LAFALVDFLRSVLDAAVADFVDVVSRGALVCVKALPAADFDVLLVAPLESVLEALVAAFFPVTLFATEHLL
jgi:hypothetical protein